MNHTKRIKQLYEKDGVSEIIRGIRDYILVNTTIPIHVLVKTKRIQVEKVRSHINIHTNHHILRTKAHGEHEILADYRRTVAEKRNPVIWDIGANIGVYTAVAAEWGGNVYAFEPGDKARKELLDNLQLNSLNDNARVLGYALSNKTGTSRLSREKRSGTRTVGEKGNKIQIRTGDSLDEPLPEIVKIDVEGHELDVLDGMEGVLSQVDTLYIEVHENHGIKKIDVYRRLWESGLKLEEEWNVREGTPHMKFERKDE